MSQRQRLGAFVLLVFLISLPVVLIGQISGARLGLGFSVSALQFVVPLIAAVLVTGWTGGRPAIRDLFRGSVQAPTRNRYLAAALIMPAVTLAAYGIARVAGQALPAWHVSAVTAIVSVPAFLLAAFCEEVGWSAYATKPLADRWGPLLAGLLLGIVWAAWHAVPYLQVHTLSWTLWQCLYTVAARVVIVALYLRCGGATTVSVIIHASINVSYTLYPNNGSAYDPAIIAPVMVCVAAAVVSVRSRREP
jgi:CAAX protease family protein